MTQLHIDIKNCYGIGKLEKDINYEAEKKTCIVYAPNGMMKTSLTKTIKSLLEGKVPKDEIFPARVSSASITIDGIDISADNIYIFDNIKADGDAYISTFLANKELKEKYDAILTKLNESWSNLRKKLVLDSRSSDCQDEILRAFPLEKGNSIYECLLKIKQVYFKEDASSFGLYEFKYNDVFDKTGKVEAFVNDNQKTITQFFDQYQAIIQESTLFSEGEGSFGTYQASSLLKSIEDDRFFKASHKLELKGGKSISSKEEFANVIDAELQRVLSDKKLKAIFDKLDKKLQGNNELRTFKEVLQNTPTLVPLLVDYEDFRRSVLLSYLQKNLDDFNILVNLYKTEKIEISKIIAEANGAIDKWNEVISLFNARFFVPFEVVLKNQSDILLNEETATLRFVYRDSSTDEKEENQTELLKTLSLGEQRAFYILQNLFEIEARKVSGKDTLIIMDDIADSFDYKNKYAIIEYLADLQQNVQFTLLILTHNFDFYRTVVSRLNVGIIFMANKKEDRTIEMCQGIYSSDILKKRFISKVTDVRPFIGLIPFTRNLIEYAQGNSCADYLLLTECLHIKPTTSDITMTIIFDIFQRHLHGVSDKVISFGTKKYIDVIYQEADAILLDTNEVDLANKLPLSMAIRLKAETYMFSILTEPQKGEMKANQNQTGELVKVFKKHYSNTHKDQCLLINKVLMLTSENIHFNNFMFEPLVDISIHHLKRLYKDTREL